MSKPSIFTDDEVKTAVAALREQNHVIDRESVRTALKERHGARGTPRPEKIDQQIAAAEADLDASARLDRLGRLSADDRARIDTLLGIIHGHLSDAVRSQPSALKSVSRR